MYNVFAKLSAKFGAAVGSEANAIYRNWSALAFQEESSLEILNPVLKKSTASSVVFDSALFKFGNKVLCL